MFPSLRFAFKQSIKNIKHNILILAISCGGFVSITFLSSFSQSIIKYQLDNNFYTLISMIQIHKKGFIGNKFKNPKDFLFEESQKIRDEIQSIPHVKDISSRISFQGVIVKSLENNGQKNYYVDAMGINPTEESKTSKLLHLWLNNKSYDHNSEPILKNNEVILTFLNKEVYLNKSKELPLLITTDADGLYSAEIVKPSNFFLENPPFEKTLLHIDFARKILKLNNNSISEIGINLDSSKNIKKVTKALRLKLGDKFEVHSWSDIYPVFLRAQKSQSFLFNFIINFLGIIVILANYAVIFMILNDRKAEIGIMTSIGIPIRNLQRTYFFEGLFVGLYGNFSGFIFSLILMGITNINGIAFKSSNTSYAIYYKVLVHPNFKEMLFVFIGGSLIVGILYDIRFYIFSKQPAIKLLKKI